MFDCLIIGGGPAGSVIGLLLANAGWSVALVEKKSFPRRKVCGEYISAATLSLLPELNVEQEFYSLAGPAVKQMGLYAGDTILSSSMPSGNGGSQIWGHALGREHLDTILLQKAKDSGVSIWQPWTACKLTREADHFGFTIKSKGKIKKLKAKIAIMAHGSWEKQAWETTVKRHKFSDLLAFKAHFTDTQLSVGSMPLLAFPGGYGGIVHTDNGRTSLSCCIQRSALKNIRHQSPGIHAGDAVLQYLFQVNLGVKKCLSSANREGDWLAVGPIQPGIRTSYRNGIFYVGNIAGEAHPIIAEGISMAIQSAWMLSNILIAYKEASKLWIDRAGKEYKNQWKRAFSRRIQAATLFAKFASSQSAVKLLLPFIKRYPEVLSLGVKLSGKTDMPLRDLFP